MKKLFVPLALAVFIFTAVFFHSCEDKIVSEVTYTAFLPQYLSYSDLRSVEMEKTASREFEKPGKIFFYQNYLFVNEYYEGIHIIDNSNPQNPQNIGFIPIPGNIDMAIKDNYLYADSYVDLVVLNIEDLNNIQTVGRVENFLPYILPQAESDLMYPYANVDNTKGVVIGWEVGEYTYTSNLNEREYPIYYYNMDNSFAETTNGVSGGNAVPTAIAGSMASFMLVGDHLYILNDWLLKTYSIENAQLPVLTDSTNISWQGETLFAYNGNLFVGTTSGMLIYSLLNPASPSFLGSFSHINSCDPVVIQGNYAFSTLRSGNDCGNTVNRLDVINIENLMEPFLVKTTGMYNPHGLAYDEELLFVCEGEYGLRIFDASNPETTGDVEIAHFEGFHAYDVIPFNGVLMLIGDDGLRQYDYSDPTNLVLLSTLEL